MVNIMGVYVDSFTGGYVGILEDIEQVYNDRQLNQIRCPVAKAIDAMTDEDAVAFRSALSDPDIEHVTLREVLKKNNYKTGERAVGNHRNRKCSCFNVR